MNEPVFITRERVDALHQRSLEEHGGQDGIRNEHGLESALAQPMHVFAYGQGDIFVLAAAYAYHLAENQPFIDGTKRTAITTALAFLELNGISTSALPNAQLYDAMIAIAEKRLDKAGLADEFRCDGGRSSGDVGFAWDARSTSRRSSRRQQAGDPGLCGPSHLARACL